MFSMRKATWGAMVALAAAVLVGCGGGGGDAGIPGPTDVRTKYLGQWRSGCEQTGPAASEIEVITITLEGTNQMKLEGKEFGYTTANCSGSSTETDDYVGTITMVGVRDDTGGRVDKITYLLEGEPAAVNGIAAVRSDRLYVTLYFPDESDPVAVDLEDFPIALSSDFLTRSP